MHHTPQIDSPLQLHRRQKEGLCLLCVSEAKQWGGKSLFSNANKLFNVTYLPKTTAVTVKYGKITNRVSLPYHLEKSCKQR